MVSTSHDPQSVIARAMRRDAKQRRRIAKARKRGRTEYGRQCTFHHLRSFDAKLAATVRANRRLRPSRRRSPETLIQIAATLNAWEGTDEQVMVRAERKASGGYRPIMAFGLRNRALQELVKGALKASAQLHPDQHVLQGGRKAAVAVITKAINDGFKFVVKTDIKDCFLSFEGDKVSKRLPVPSTVTNSVLVSRELNLVHTHSRTTPTRLGFAIRSRRGIPQGSTVSSLVAEVLLSDIPATIPSSARVVMYADDLLVFGRTKTEARTIAKALCAALERHSAGSLNPKICETKRVCDCFDFLGYRFSRQYGKAKIEPAQASLAKFRRNCYERLLDGALDGSGFEPVRRYIRSWVPQCAAWEDRHLFGEIALAEMRREAARLDHLLRLCPS